MYEFRVEFWKRQSDPPDEFFFFGGEVILLEFNLLIIIQTHAINTIIDY